MQVTGGKRPRIASLDVARGLMLVTSVVSDSLLTAPPFAQHAAWEGVTALDVIFPVFVTMTGCGIAFAYARGIQRPGRLVRRVVVLAIVGLLYNAITSWAWDPGTWRIFGVLQLYAVVILVVSLAHVVARSVRAWVIVVAIVAAVTTALHLVWAVRCGTVTPECNPSASIDLRQAWLQHTYHQGTQGHDPEGLVSIAGATLQASIGALFGHVILRARDAGWGVGRIAGTALVLAAGLAVAAVAAIAAPQLLGADPLLVMKRLWTPPFALLVGAGTGVVLMLCFAAIDRGTEAQRHRRLVPLEPLLALGRNSLLVYFGSHVVNSLMHRAGWMTGLHGGVGELLVPAATLVAWIVLAMLLNRRSIYIRA